MALGSTHTLTATPDKGWVFQDWSTIGLSDSVNTNSRTLQFTFLSNTVITANFIPDPFTVAQGRTTACSPKLMRPARQFGRLFSDRDAQRQLFRPLAHGAGHLQLQFTVRGTGAQVVAEIGGSR